MLVQVIEGKAGDAEGLKRQMQRWNDELQSGAKGFIGSTFGITSDGTCIGFACFDSLASAEANSKRAQQSAWWKETEKFYDGDVTFRDTTDVEQVFGDIQPSAGFVQVMKGRVTDRKKLKQLETTMMDTMSDMRADVIGSMRAYFDGGDYAEFVYFTSEADARAAESQSMPENVTDAMNEWQSIAQVTAWYDLKEPWITKP
jgi:hypothetical protein